MHARLSTEPRPHLHHQNMCPRNQFATIRGERRSDHAAPHDENVHGARQVFPCAATNESRGSFTLASPTSIDMCVALICPLAF